MRNQIPDLPAIACEPAVVAAGWTRTLFASTRLVDVQCASADFFAVQCGHGGLSLRFVIHRDESEATRLTSHAVHHQRYFADLTVLFEKILEIVFSCLKGEITYVQFHVI